MRHLRGCAAMDTMRQRATTIEAVKSAARVKTGADAVARSHVSVIPGCAEGADPESRDWTWLDSGFALRAPRNDKSEESSFLDRRGDFLGRGRRQRRRGASLLRLGTRTRRLR